MNSTSVTQGSTQEIQSNQTYKFQELRFCWSEKQIQNLQMNINLETLFQCRVENRQNYEQIVENLQTHIRPDLENFLRQNRKYIKLVKPARQSFQLENEKQTEIQLNLKYKFKPRQIHLYTNYLKINENVKRLETQDQLFKYNFSTALRNQLKLEILKFPTRIWRSQKEGIKHMFDLFQKYSLQMDFIHQFAVYMFLIPEDINIQRNPEAMDQIFEQKEFLTKCEYLNIQVNEESLKLIFQQLSSNYLRLKTNNIFQTIKKLPPQPNLNLYQDLSYKSFQTDKYINFEKAFICNICQQFHQECECKLENNLIELRDFLLVFMARSVKRKYKLQKKSRQSKIYSQLYEWARSYLKIVHSNPCSKECYKQTIFDVPSTECLVEEYYPIDITRDICQIAKQEGIDCYTIYLMAVHKIETIRSYYIQQIQQLQKKYDSICYTGDPNQMAYLYLPCSHKDDFKCDNCQCQKHQFCSKLCDCSGLDCKQKIKGCQCTGICNGDDCICFRNKIECDPLICKCMHKTKDQICMNMQVLMNTTQQTYTGHSSVCPGLGIFAPHFIQKGQLILLYIGEILFEDEDEIRDQFDDTSSFYSYTLQDDTYGIEARYCGNEARFLNHNKANPNCCAVQLYCQGRFHIAIFARKDIEEYEEMLIDYDRKDSINREIHKWILNNDKFCNYLQDVSIKRY